MIKASLSEGEIIDAGRFTVQRKNGRIVTDRSKVIRGHEELKSVCETPELRDGFDVKIYIDENMAEVFVNSGEYVITNAVYDLTDNVSSDGNIEIYALEG